MKSKSRKVKTWTSTPKIDLKNLPNKSQQRFYNFGLLSVFPRVLSTWAEIKDQGKYFFDKPGMSRWYVHKVKEAAYRYDWISVIIYAIIILYQREKLK